MCGFILQLLKPDIAFVLRCFAVRFYITLSKTYHRLFILECFKNCLAMPPQGLDLNFCFCGVLVCGLILQLLKVRAKLLHLENFLKYNLNLCTDFCSTVYWTHCLLFRHRFVKDSVLKTCKGSAFVTASL